MAVFTGTTLAWAALGFTLLTSCGGRASSLGADRNAGDHLGSDAGKGGEPNDSAAGLPSAAGAVSSATGGAPGSAGRSASGGSAGDAAHAGSPSAAGNGADSGGAAGAVGSAGTAGSVGSAGSTSAAVTAACTSLCIGWIQGCSIWEFAPTCTSDCASDLAVQNGACTDRGLAMLSCMTATSGNANTALCTTAFTNAIGACRAQVDAFLACSAAGGPAPQPRICMRAGNPFPEGGCAENRYCLNNVSSELKCANAPGGQSTCDCWNYDLTTKASSGADDLTFDGQSGDLCLNHMDDCLAYGTMP